MAIYDTGTASLASNGRVTGVGTQWTMPLNLIRVGATLVFKTEPVQIYTISEITSDTSLAVYNPNGETVPNGTGYAILAHDGISVQGLAQDVAETLRYYQSRETEVADAVNAFNNFDAADFDSKVSQVNTQHGDVVSIGTQVANDAIQVSSDKDAAAESALSASGYKDEAAISAQEAADYAASIDAQNILRKDMNLFDLVDKSISRDNLDVYSKSEVDSINNVVKSNENSIQRPLPVTYRTIYSQDIVGTTYPQAISEDEQYIYMTEDVSNGGSYACRISRINKESNVKETHPQTFQTRGQGIGVTSDGLIFIGGNTNSQLNYVNFSSGTSYQEQCPGMYKDFPFCYDKKSDLIYQLQDADATSGNITRMAIISRSSGFKSDCSIDKRVVKPWYPQGLTTDGSFIYITSGNSWQQSSSGSHNNTWGLFKVSLSGVVIDRFIFDRSSMSSLNGGLAVTSHEPQGVSWFKGELSMMQYVGSSSSTKAIIFKQDYNGVSIRSRPYNDIVVYNSLSELGVNVQDLTSGSSILSIVNAMPDNSKVVFSISGETSLYNDTGIQYGVCKVTKINQNRAYCTSVESSSLVSTTSSPLVSYVSIYGTIQSKANILVQGRQLVEAYSSTSVVTGATTITVPGISSSNSISIQLTNASPGNAVVSHRFTSKEMKYFIDNSIAARVNDNVSSFIEFRFTSTGINVLASSGSPIIRRILVE